MAPMGPFVCMCTRLYTRVHVYTGVCVAFAHTERAGRDRGSPEAGLCSQGELPACRQGRLRPRAQVWPLSPTEPVSGWDAGRGVMLRVWVPCDDSVWAGDRQAVALGGD